MSQSVAVLRPHLFLELLHMACGIDRGGAESDARRTQLAVGSLVGALILSAIWGLAAGSGSPALAAANLVKVPIVVLLSVLFAFPAAGVALKLMRTRFAVRDLFTSTASAVFGGSLVLAVLAPIVALYYHTSSATGASLAVASAFAALAVAALILARNAVAHTPDDESRGPALIAVAVMLLLTVATMLQLIAVVSPIIAEVTPFDGGIDRLLGR